MRESDLNIIGIFNADFGKKVHIVLARNHTHALRISTSFPGDCYHTPGPFGNDLGEGYVIKHPRKYWALTKPQIEILSKSSLFEYIERDPSISPNA